MFASGFLDLVYGSLVSSWLLWGPVTITDGHGVCEAGRAFWG